MFLDDIGYEDGVRLASLRDLTLKARQFGFSTLIGGLLFLDTINNRNTNTIIMAHDLESAEKLFRMQSRFYDFLPEGKPETQYASKREIYWPSINSRVSIMTAGKGTAGRGDTINNLHMSEWAFWDNEDVLTGLLQAIPTTGNVFGETTANGRGNQFYEEYQLATGKLKQTEDGRTKSVFNAHFYPWHWHPEYTAEPGPGFTATEEELVLQAQHSLMNGQLQWRRNKIAEPGMGAMFPQEYPSDDEEAFRVTGKAFFDTFIEDQHCITPIFTREQPPPRWYTFVGGLDWGYADPYAFTVGCVDETGAVHCLCSHEQSRLSNAEQAELVCEGLAWWSIPKDKFILVCDESMWSQKTINGVKAEPDIADFQRAGLRCVKASNAIVSIQHRNNQIRAFLRVPGKFKIYRGFNSAAKEGLEGARHDPTKREMVLHDKFSHIVVAIGNMLSTRPNPAEDPGDPNDTGLEFDGRKIVNIPEEELPYYLQNPEKQADSYDPGAVSEHELAHWG
jgi:hypothetical protein